MSILSILLFSCVKTDPWDGWSIGFSIPREEIYASWCTHKWGCNVACDSISAASQEPDCLATGSGKLDCLSEGKDKFCNKLGNSSDLECATDGKCYPEIINCENHTDCPAWFYCGEDFRCLEMTHLCDSNGCEEVSPTGLVSSPWSVSCSEISSCAPWEICDISKSICYSALCDFIDGNEFMHLVCPVGYQCRRGFSGGLLKVWPPRSDYVWTLAGDCVESSLCNTNEECMEEGYSACDQRNTCID